MYGISTTFPNLEMMFVEGLLQLSSFKITFRYQHFRSGPRHRGQAFPSPDVRGAQAAQETGGAGRRGLSRSHSEGSVPLVPGGDEQSGAYSRETALLQDIFSEGQSKTGEGVLMCVNLIMSPISSLNQTHFSPFFIRTYSSESYFVVL